MMKIGVSSCFLHPDGIRANYPLKTLQYMERDLVRYLSGETVLPVLIPDVPENLLKNYLQELDGLVLHGGVDMAPQSYGESPIDPVKWPGDAYRDQYELTLVRLAFDLKKPILGICRGHQVLNVFFGGTLYQDISTQLHGSLNHRDAVIYDKLHHDVDVLPGGYLASLYGEGLQPLAINTVHHQGIKKLGKDLRVEAVCPGDQMVESISYVKREEQFVLGLQWHPEYSHSLSGKVICEKRIYETFIQECQKGKSR